MNLLRRVRRMSGIGANETNLQSEKVTVNSKRFETRLQKVVKYIETTEDKLTKTSIASAAGYNMIKSPAGGYTFIRKLLSENYIKEILSDGKVDFVITQKAYNHKNIKSIQTAFTSKIQIDDKENVWKFVEGILKKHKEGNRALFIAESGVTTQSEINKLDGALLTFRQQKRVVTKRLPGHKRAIVYYLPSAPVSKIAEILPQAQKALPQEKNLLVTEKEVKVVPIKGDCDFTYSTENGTIVLSYKAITKEELVKRIAKTLDSFVDC